MSKNLTALSARKGLKNNLFEKIGALAEKEGAPSKENLHQLAEEFRVGPANLLGAASFYDFTKSDNLGKKVFVCNGTACMLAGTQEKLKEELQATFSKDEIGEMCCLGRCHENAAFHFKGGNYSCRTPNEIATIITGNTDPSQESYTVDSFKPAILTAPPLPLEDYQKGIKQMLADKPEQVLTAIDAAKLRGRGGAGFPIGLKMKTCLEAKTREKYIVCNADEGDPGSYSDRYLLEQRPYAVLMGMLIAGYAIGANIGIIYIRYEYPQAIAVIEKAIKVLKRKQLAGSNILESNFSFEFKIIKARGAYICGEETALLASIEGQRPEVRIRPPYPAEEGLFGKPTLVNNVETLANLYFILVNTGAAFAKIGTVPSSGTKLLSVDSAFNRPGVYEVPMGTPLSIVVDELGRGFRKPVKALHIGGPLGGVVPIDKISELSVDFESFQKNGFLLGHASVVSIPESYPMIDYLAHLFAFTAHESCGKCFPCRLGSVRGQELMQKAKEENQSIDPHLLNDLLETLEIGSLCGLGGGLPLPVRNILQYFQEELKPYFQTEFNLVQ